ncbi:MAG: 50S ribosomal protein L11 methyltransferase [Solirubrobacterales bacterium]
MLAELLAASPAGVEEDAGEGWVEYAVYGPPGELPDLGTVDAAAEEGVVEVTATEVPDDWEDRWQAFHRPVTIAGSVHVRPPWAQEPGDDLIDVVVDPGRGFGTGAHPTTRLCLELLIDLSRDGHASGALADWGTGSGVLAVAAARLGWDPIVACDHDPAALDNAEANLRANEVTADVSRVDVRRQRPPGAPTVVANLLTPLLVELASGPEPEDSRPERLVCSGLLASEADTVAEAFAAWGLAEHDRRTDSEWAALLLEAERR